MFRHDSCQANYSSLCTLAHAVPLSRYPRIQHTQGDTDAGRTDCDRTEPLVTRRGCNDPPPRDEVTFGEIYVFEPFAAQVPTSLGSNCCSPRNPNSGRLRNRSYMRAIIDTPETHVGVECGRRLQGHTTKKC